MKPNSFVSKFICILFFYGMLGAACLIPFYFESPSLFYKTGIDKLMLRSGKIFGIIAAGLMVFQPVLVGRFLLLDKIFTIKKLFQLHRIHGSILLGAALIHPVLILGADQFVFFPFEPKYWPEITGIFLLLLLFPFVVISISYKHMGLTYKNWRILHKTVAPVIFVLMFSHVFNVSKSFESGLPFYLLIAAGAITALLFTRKFLS